jgi:hypothetical protein
MQFNSWVFLQNGSEYIYPIVIPVRRECVLYLFGDISKLTCHTLPLEDFTTSEEIMLFHAYGPIMFRYSCNYNESSNAGNLFNRLDD